MKILLRADATPAMGAGHVMRCLALALHAAARGLEAVICGRVEVPWVIRRIVKERIAFLRLDGPTPERENADALLGVVRECAPDVVVLDGYHFGSDCQKAVRSTGVRLVVIDDCNHLPEYHADILLNQNPGSERLRYKGEIGEKLLGPGYALLRPEFLKARPLAEKRIFPERPRNILLTLGGGDFGDHLARMAPELSIPEMAGRVLCVVAGGTPERRIRQLLAACPACVEILRQVDAMPELLLDTDLCVTAGGSTCWELCCLGVPFLMVETAENQRGIIKEAIRSGVAALFSAISLRDSVEPELPFHGRRGKMMSLVDGSGATAVISHLANSHANHV